MKFIVSSSSLLKHLQQISGVINANAEVQHNHANDSVLADLKGLKSTLASGDLFSWDGSNVVAQASSAFATATALNDLQSDVNGKVDQTDFNNLETTVGDKASQSALDDVVSDLSDLTTTVGQKLNSADQYISSVAAGVLSVTAGELSIDLNSYATTTALNASIFISSVDATVPELSVDGAGELSVNLSAYAKTEDISDFVTSSELATELSPYALQTELSSKADASALNDYVQIASLGTEFSNLGTAEVGANNTFKHNKKQERVKQVSFSNTFSEVLSLPASNSMAYLVEVECVYRTSDLSKNGSVKYSAVWKKLEGTCSYVQESASALGDCTGEEFQVVNSSGNMSVQVKGSTSMTNSGEVSVFARWMEC